MKTKQYRLFLMDRHESVYQESLQAIAIALQNLVVTLLLARDATLYLAWQAQLPLVLQRIVEGYINDSALSEADYDAYASLLPIMMRSGNENLLRRYVAMGCDFSVARSLALSLILGEANHHAAAMALFEHVLKETTPESASFFYHAGIAYYLAGRFILAERYFVRALELGSTENAIISYRTWIKESGL